MCQREELLSFRRLLDGILNFYQRNIIMKTLELKWLLVLAYVLS